MMYHLLNPQEQSNMNSFAIVAFFACLAAVCAAPSAEILQGPSSRTTVVGPDGSAISAVAPGGQVIHEENPGVVAASVVAPAPVVATYSAVPHGVPAVVARAAPVVAHHTAYAAPVVAHHTAYAAPVVAHHSAYSAPVVSHIAPAARVIVPAGHGLEGQYVHDFTETLYDDGSYKPHIY